MLGVCSKDKKLFFVVLFVKKDFLDDVCEGIRDMIDCFCFDNLFGGEERNVIVGMLEVKVVGDDSKGF